MPDFDVVMYTDYLWEKHTKNNTKEKREIGEKSNRKKEWWEKRAMREKGNRKRNQ